MRVATGNATNISDDDKRFIKFLSDARTGSINSEGFKEFLNKLNKENLVDFPTDALKNAHPNAIWIGNTKAETHEMNNTLLDNLKLKGNFVVRVIAHHTPTSSSLPPPNKEQSEILYSLTPERDRNINTPTYMDLCVGSMVMLTTNIGTEIGLTNGTIGEIVMWI